MKKRATWIAAGVVLVGVAVSAGYWLGHAEADGIPMTDTLAYSGTLLEGGVPEEDDRNIAVALYRSEMGSTPECLRPSMMTAVTRGRFRVVLPPDCVADVHANPDIWVQVEVDGTPLPRTHIGAVPYAIEAANATVSSRHHVGVDSEEIAVGGTFCGATDPRSASAGGYAGVKSICEIECLSPTASLCTLDDVVRSAQLGITVPGGRVTGDRSIFNNPEGTLAQHIDINDCNGFSTTAANRASQAWSGSAPDLTTCDVSAAFLCCD